MVEKRIVGTLSLLDIGGQQAALRKMFVHSNYRGAASGAASELLETLLSWASDRGVVEMFLGTTIFFDAAHRFFEKNGFVEIPMSRLPATFPIMAVDTKFFRRALDEVKSQ